MSQIFQVHHLLLHLHKVFFSHIFPILSGDEGGGGLMQTPVFILFYYAYQPSHSHFFACSLINLSVSAHLLKNSYLSKMTEQSLVKFIGMYMP